MRMVTVVDPRYDPERHGPIKLSDYMLVPHLDTIGGFRFHEILSLRGIKILADLANRLEKEAKRAPRKGLRDNEVRWRA